VTALLAPPFARYAAVAALFGAVALWGWSERAGRQVAALEAQAARREAAAANERIKNMETRNAVEDRVRREPDAVGRLREEWTRPD
jgi:hypothetical protein